MKITDGYQGNCVEVDENCLLVKGVSDLVATLKHAAAMGPSQLRMKDMESGEVFAISYLGKEETEKSN